MNKKEEVYPTEMYLTKVKKEVDMILDNPELADKYPTSEGCGRIIIIIGDIALKIPYASDFIEEEVIEGLSQNAKEYEVYLEAKHPLLNPVYEIYKGCLLCKAVEDDFSKVMKKYLFTEKEIMEQIKANVKELQPIINKHKLNKYEMAAERNWGYDSSKNKFVCLDYGI